MKEGSLWVPPPDEFGVRPHRTAIQKWALHDLVWHLPNVQYVPERLPNDFWPRTSTFTQSGGHVRFACAELARHAILWGNSLAMLEGRTLHVPPRSMNQLAALISNSLALRLEVEVADPAVLERDGVHAFLFATMSPQWEFMRSYAFRSTQATWMFDDALRSRERRSGGRPAFAALRATIDATLGMSVPEFVGCVQMLFARSMSGTPNLDSGTLYLSPEIIRWIAPWLIATAKDRKLYSARLAQTFNLLAASQAELRKTMIADAGTNDELALLKRPNPLQRRPIVLPFSNSRAFGIAPVPHLLMEFLYEPLIDLLYSAARGAGVAAEFNQLFEEYVGLLLQRHSPATLRWHHEDDLRPATGRVVDWAAEFPSHVVLVDAKRAWLEPAFRHRFQAGDWTRFHTTMLEGVDQGASFWRSVAAGQVPALRSAAKKRPVLVLAVGSDARLVPYPEKFRRELREAAHRAFPGLHVVVVWLDQLHALLNTWQGRNVDWLAETLSRSRRADGPELDSQLKYGVSGPMWRAFTEPLRNAVPDFEDAA